jgi:hypothetical protein
MTCLQGSNSRINYDNASTFYNSGIISTLSLIFNIDMNHSASYSSTMVTKN